MNTLATNRLRVAIIGAGYVARYHVAALSGLNFVEIVGICDPDLRAAEALAAKFKIPNAVKTLRELESSRPTTAFVLTPPATHCALALNALDFGCHVFVEKPMADSVAECDAMIAKARETGRVLSVNHSDLFDPTVARTLSLVNAGECGDVVAVDILRSSDYPAYAGGPLPAVIKLGSYPFRDLGVHALYTIEALLGPVRQLDVAYRSTGFQPNLQFDEWHGTAVCERGLGRFLLSWNVRPMQNRLLVHGTGAVIEADRFLQICRVGRVLPGPKFIGIVVGAFMNAVKDCFRIPWGAIRFAIGRLKPSPGIQSGAQAFIQALHEGKPPPISAEAGRHVVALIEAACARADLERSRELASRLAPLDPVDTLVTGAAGFLGRRLVAALLEHGQRVRVLLRKPSGLYSPGANVQVVIGDLGDPEIVQHAVRGANIVYHVGAAMRGSARDFEAGTVVGTRNVVDACLEHGVDRLVYVSSLSVLDAAGRQDTIPVTEASPLEPFPQKRGAYTQTKLAAEHLVQQAIRDRGLPAVIVRPGQIFGPGAESVAPNGTIALAGRWIAVGPATQTLPLVFIDDVVDALQSAAKSPAAVGHVFNLVDPATVTQQEYFDRCRARKGSTLRIMRAPTGLMMFLASGVELLGKVLRRDVSLTRYRVRSLHPLANFDLQAAQTVLDWQPKTGLARGLDRTFGPLGATTASTHPDASA